MRRTSVALASLLALLLLAVPAAAVAEAAVDILAVEGADTLGPDPMDRNAEGNAATELSGFGDQDIPFTWGAAWILTAAGALALGLGYLFYRFRVKPHA